MGISGRGYWRANWARVAVAVMAAAGASFIALPAVTAGATARSTAKPTATPAPLNIGVDHADPANQQPQNGRLFEYTDFFSRDFTVAQGQSVNFNFAGFHSVALVTNLASGLAGYPVLFPDGDDTSPNGGPHIQTGPGFFPVQGGDVTNPPQGTEFGAQAPSCGLSGQPVCTFSGGNDFESSGPIGGVTWQVQITAAPGNYFMYCTIHPGMVGNFTVVPTGQPGSEQQDINAIGNAQFHHERADALATEQSLNHIDVSGTPGHRNFKVRVGASADENHVAIDEMFPNRQTLNLVPGDKVTYLWTDKHIIHSVKFPDDVSSDPSPFGFDCASGYVPPGGPPCTETGEGTEFILDPGSTASGQPLTSPTAVANSGLIVGKGYGIPGVPSKWSVTTNTSTTNGTYTFHCTLHDWMSGQISLAGS